MEVTREKFSLRELKLEKGIKVSYTLTEDKDGEILENEYTVKIDAPVHDDVRIILTEIAESVIWPCLGLKEMESLITPTPIGESIEDILAKQRNSIKVYGVKSDGENYDLTFGYGTKIGELKCKTPKINRYSLCIDALKSLYEDLEEEMYLFIFMSKRLEMTVYGADREE